MSQQRVPPRLAVLLAPASTKAVVICRHTSKRTAIIGWDRRDDSFAVSQWLKGKLYPYRSDISPDGTHWIYFAMSEKNRSYTVVAKTPYLKALDFYPKRDAWNGGGLFLSNHRYWLNDGGCPHEAQRQASGLAVTRVYPGDEEPEPGLGEDPYIYFRRLQREGWAHRGFTETSRFYAVPNGYQTFVKRIDRRHDLIKHFHAQTDHPIGRGCYYETYRLYNRETGETTDCVGWEWADTDGSRIVWAENGKLFSARNGEVPGKAKLLFDTVPLRFKLMEAPY